MMPRDASFSGSWWHFLQFCAACQFVAREIFCGSFSDRNKRSRIVITLFFMICGVPDIVSFAVPNQSRIVSVITIEKFGFRFRDIQRKYFSVCEWQPRLRKKIHREGANWGPPLEPFGTPWTPRCSILSMVFSRGFRRFSSLSDGLKVRNCCIFSGFFSDLRIRIKNFPNRRTAISIPRPCPRGLRQLIRGLPWTSRGDVVCRDFWGGSGGPWLGPLHTERRFFSGIW